MGVEFAEQDVSQRRWRWWGLFSLVVLIGAGSWYWLQRDRGDPSYDFVTVQVDRGDIVQRIVSTGRLQPLRTVQVGSQISGIIEEILVDFNSEVRRGQVVARLDPSTFAANVRLAQAELASAQASYELAQVQVERLQSLRGSELITPAEMEEAEVV